MAKPINMTAIRARARRDKARDEMSGAGFKMKAGTSVEANKMLYEREHSPLTKARSHLDKETERGDHSPKVGGHGTSQHGGRVSSNETSHSFANEPEDNLKGSKGSGYRD